MKSQDVSLVDCCTLVLWAACFIVGATGLALPHRLPSALNAGAPPIVATMLNVAIGDLPSAPALDSPRQPPFPRDADPPPQEAVQSPNAAPPLQTVAMPDSKIAFALPTRSPGLVVAAAAAVPSRSAATPETPRQTAAASVNRLVFGQGAGRQPAPEYPREAAIAGEEGTVVVQFAVGSDGRVISAIAKIPCRSAILNQAAIRAIRDSWRFKPAAPITYEISIIFQLNN